MRWKVLKNWVNFVIHSSCWSSRSRIPCWLAPSFPAGRRRVSGLPHCWRGAPFPSTKRIVRGGGLHQRQCRRPPRAANL